jgi:Protein of unknown function (DUF2726)
MSHHTLFNLSEKRTYNALSKVVSAHDAKVFGKVRVADVLKLNNSGIPDDLYKFALQSHFDFLVINSNYDPQFAVEFDGPYHVTPVQKNGINVKTYFANDSNFPCCESMTTISTSH